MLGLKSYDTIIKWVIRRLSNLIKYPYFEAIHEPKLTPKKKKNYPNAMDSSGVGDLEPISLNIV